jgi:ParB-like chromosome segregation protein Spo0J
MEPHLAAIARLADERAVAVRELLDHGFTRSEVARRLGVTPAVITKILRRPVVGEAGALVRAGEAPPQHDRA